MIISCQNCRGDGLAGAGHEPWLKQGPIGVCTKCGGTGKIEIADEVPVAPVEEVSIPTEEVPVAGEKNTDVPTDQTDTETTPVA